MHREPNIELPETRAGVRPLSIEQDRLLHQPEEFSLADFLERHPEPMSTKHKIIKGLGFVTGAAGGVPFYTPARNFSQNAALSHAMGISTLICLGSNVVWMTDELLSEFWRAPTLVEERIPTRLKKSTRLSVSTILGVMSLSSQLYLSYQYNDRNVFWPILVLVTTVAYRINGYYQGLKLFERRAPKETLTLDEVAARKKLALRLKSLSKNPGAIREIQNSADRLARFKEYLMGEGQEIGVLEAKDSCKGYAPRILELIGILSLPAPFIFISYILTEAALEKVVTMPAIVSYPLAALMEFPSAVIKIRAGMQLPKVIYDHVYNHFKFPERASVYMEELPCGFLGMSLMILLIAGFSFGSTGYAMRGEVSEELNDHVLPFLVMANILFHFVGLMTNLSSVLDYTLGRSSVQKAETIFLRDKCDELSSAVEALPFSFFQKVKAELSNEITEEKIL